MTTRVFGLVYKFEATERKTSSATPLQSRNLITASNVRWEICLLNTAYLGGLLLLCEVSSNLIKDGLTKDTVRLVAERPGIPLLPGCHRDMK
jgi:hypothetical protein